MIGKNYFLLLIFILVNIIFSEISVKIAVSEQSIYYGDNIQLEIEVDGGDENCIIDTGLLDEFFVLKSVGNQSRNSNIVQIINGQITRQESRGHLFVYMLTPKSDGRFTIGPIKVTYEKKEYFSNSISVKVHGPEKGNHAFMKIISSGNDYILGEKFTISLEIYIKKLTGELKDLDPFFPREPISLKIPWLQEKMDGLQKEEWIEILRPHLVESSKPGFHINDIAAQDNSIFAMFESTKAKFLPKKETVTTQSPLGKVGNYLKYTITQSFEAEKIGVYTFGPTLLKGLIASKTLPGGRAESKRIVVTAKPIQIKINDVPSDGRPDSYNGAIGSFTFSVHLLSNKNNKKTYVGDLMDIVLTIKGAGTLENIIAPKLSEQPEITNFFKIYDDNVNSEIKKNTKTFQYSIRSLKTTKNIPPIYFSYFNTKTRQYHTISSEEIPVEIEKALSVPDEEISAATGVQKQNLVTGLDKGIFANYEKKISSQNENAPIFYQFILVGMPLIYILFASFVFYQKKWGSDIVYQRKKKAFSRAQQRLEEENNLSESELCTSKLNAIKGYVADLFHINEQGLVSGELLNLLKEKITTDTYQKLEHFLELCESSTYGVSTVNSEVIESSNQLLQTLDNEIKKKK